MSKLKIGVIGMAVMGRNLALNMGDHGYDVAIYNRSPESLELAVQADTKNKLKPFKTLEEFVEALERPRSIVLMIKAGEPVDLMIQKLLPLLDPDDLIIDCGNSYFKDTRRRAQELAPKNIRYLGVGVSGGEDGARFGPAMMPGGDPEAYARVQELFEAISAKAKDGKPCCHYASTDGAGHYVKMVHNGIEYADMQIIAEAYTFMRDVLEMNQLEMAKQFERYNEGPLSSYLIEITADVLREQDPDSEHFLLQVIQDEAQQKGTGLWTNREAIDLSVETSILVAGLNARVMSAMSDEREKASEIYPREDLIKVPANKTEQVLSELGDAMYAAKLMAYAQGFDLLRHAAEAYGWDFDYAGIAAGFRNGCIIRAELLENIMRAFTNEPDIPNLLLSKEFCEPLKAAIPGLRRTCVNAIETTLAIPAMTAALGYFDAYRTHYSGANLIQGLRDYFGAHTFERTDKPGSFHHKWGDNRVH